MEYDGGMRVISCLLNSAPGESVGLPLWLALFGVAGFLLFLFKISGNPQNGDEKWPKLRLFYLVSVILFAIAGIADFLLWVRPQR
jgi:hypothetical protein